MKRIDRSIAPTYRRSWRVIIIICFAIISLYVSYDYRSSRAQEAKSAPQNNAEAMKISRANPYANNNGQIPTKYSGPTFKLSYDYPATLPPISPVLQQISEHYSPLTQENINDYLLALRGYVYDALLPVDWYADQIKDRSQAWFNSPWLGEANYLTGWPGREVVRGMYLGSIQQKTKLLGPAQTEPYYSYAIEIYNNRGGYTLGKIWQDIKNPDFKAVKFEEGTVVAKLNFTPATLEQVPALKDSIEWQINITPADAGPGIVIPTLTTVRQIQLDIIVRDSRNSPQTGWVFATYVYDQNAKGNGWEKMVPSGLMIGNDPGVTPLDVQRGTKLKETLLSSLNPKLNTRTLGWAGRLSGPADNGETSSCLSCHGTAQWQPIAPLVPTAPKTQKTPLTPQQRLAWFLNNPGNVPFTTGQIATDYDWVVINAAMNAMATNGVLGADVPNEALKNRRTKRSY